MVIKMKKRDRLLLINLLLSCSSFQILAQKEVTIIKEDLNNRYVQYEVIQIKPDSANVYEAINTMRAVKMRVSEYNNDILKIFQKISNGYDRHKGYDAIITLRKELYDFMLNFESSQFSRPDPCFYVKYRFFKDGLKIPLEEYYHLRLMYNGEYDIIHRPVDWNEFLQSKGYDKVIRDSKKYSQEITELNN
jgi:hypothetical protein